MVSAVLALDAILTDTKKKVWFSGHIPRHKLKVWYSRHVPRCKVVALGETRSMTSLNRSNGIFATNTGSALVHADQYWKWPQ